MEACPLGMLHLGARPLKGERPSGEGPWRPFGHSSSNQAANRMQQHECPQPHNTEQKFLSMELSQPTESREIINCCLAMTLWDGLLHSNKQQNVLKSYLLNYTWCLPQVSSQENITVYTFHFDKDSTQFITNRNVRRMPDALQCALASELFKNMSPWATLSSLTSLPGSLAGWRSRR